MSTLLKWAQNTTQSARHHHSNRSNLNGNSNSSTNGSSGGERKWIHPPDALQKGHIAYLVKFLGNTPVDQPKGIEVVKEGIRKLRFTQQLKKSETGAKTKKVELTISADGVAIQEPRTHTILHQFPLHRISYCADDKGEKKFFSFIAKQPSPDNDQEQDKHECFVFVSDKLAEEITLTIGQAFELAYRRFLETSGKDLESQRRAMITQQRIKRLEQENNIYKQRLLEVSLLHGCRTELEGYLRKNGLKNLLELPSALTAAPNGNTGSSGNTSTTNSTSSTFSDSMSARSTDDENGMNGNGSVELLDLSIDTNPITNGNGNYAPPVPPRQFETTPTVGTKLEGLLLNEFELDQDFDPRSFENNDHINNHVNKQQQFFPITNGTTSPPPLLAPPPKAAKRQTINNNNNNNGNIKTTFGQDLFGATPFGITTPSITPTLNSAKIIDPFEMGDFSPSATPQDIENAIGLLDKRIMEMKNGFSRGISFGNDDFSLESLDPLKN